MRDSQSYEYDMQKRARAVTSATLRAVVALYIGYLGYNIIKGVREGTTTMAPGIGWTAGLFFLAAALGVCFYAWKRYRQDVEAARLPVNEEPTEELTDDNEEADDDGGE